MENNEVIEPTNEELEEPDFDFDDEETTEPDGYECFCCGNIQMTTGFGNTCDKCGACALNEFHF